MPERFKVVFTMQGAIQVLGFRDFKRRRKYYISILQIILCCV